MTQPSRPHRIGDQSRLRPPGAGRRQASFDQGRSFVCPRSRAGSRHHPGRSRLMLTMELRRVAAGGRRQLRKGRGTRRSGAARTPAVRDQNGRNLCGDGPCSACPVVDSGAAGIGVAGLSAGAGRRIAIRRSAVTRDGFVDSTLLQHVAASLARVFAALAAVLVIGVPVGLAMGLEQDRQGDFRSDHRVHQADPAACLSAAGHHLARHRRTVKDRRYRDRHAGADHTLYRRPACAPCRGTHQCRAVHGRNAACRSSAT